jgi:hypothetical protein
VNSYHVAIYATDDDATFLYWFPCEADDEQHAREQAEDHVSSTTGETVGPVRDAE